MDECVGGWLAGWTDGWIDKDEDTCVAGDKEIYIRTPGISSNPNKYFGSQTKQLKFESCNIVK